MYITDFQMRLLGLGLIILFLGYLLGVFLPFNFRIAYSDKPCSSGEYYYYVITTIGVVMTLFTIIVALFKEDIIRAIKQVKLNFVLKEKEDIREVTETIKDDKKAIKY